jgi:DNA-directed RNA polymerase specialized sigma24 family protein
MQGKTMTSLCSGTWADAVGRAYAAKRLALLGYLRKLGIYGLDAEDVLQDATLYALGKPAAPKEAERRLVGACAMRALLHHRTERTLRKRVLSISNGADALVSHAAYEQSERDAEATEIAEATVGKVLLLLSECPVRHATACAMQIMEKKPLAVLAVSLGVTRAAVSDAWKRTCEWIRCDMAEAERRRV